MSEGRYALQVTKRMRERLRSLELVLGDDFRRGFREMGFILDWMLSGAGTSLELGISMTLITRT